MLAKERSRDRISRRPLRHRPLLRSTADDVDLVRRDVLTDKTRMRSSRRFSRFPRDPALLLTEKLTATSDLRESDEGKGTCRERKDVLLLAYLCTTTLRTHYPLFVYSHRRLFPTGFSFLEYNKSRFSSGRLSVHLSVRLSVHARYSFGALIVAAATLTSVGDSR